MLPILCPAYHSPPPPQLPPRPPFPSCFSTLPSLFSSLVPFFSYSFIPLCLRISSLPPFPFLFFNSSLPVFFPRSLLLLFLYALLSSYLLLFLLFFFFHSLFLSLPLSLHPLSLLPFSRWPLFRFSHLSVLPFCLSYFLFPSSLSFFPAPPFNTYINYNNYLLYIIVNQLLYNFELFLSFSWYHGLCQKRRQL
jgi:hypothetical protein